MTSPHKIGGCCSLCDEPCFEIMALWDEGELRAGEPKATGAPNKGTTTVSFLLLSGSYTSMTFCANCAKSLAPEHYTLLWRKNLAAYARGGAAPEKFADEFANVLLCELGRNEVNIQERGNLLG